jgi:pimeloyl-ACP methyl ester carboxylesterase
MALPEARRGYPSYRRAGYTPARPVEPRFAESRGFRVAYDDVGMGPVVLLIHGVTLSGGDWWEVGAVDQLVAAGYRVLVADPLGHGQSDSPVDPADYRLPDVALDMAAVIDAARAERVVAWGYSRGALLATALAVEVPERLAALVVGGSGGMQRVPSPELADWMRGLLGGDWQAFWDGPIGAGYTPDDRRYAEAVMSPAALGAAFAGRRLFRYDLRLDAVGCPVLLYQGGEDSPDDAQATAVGLRTVPRLLPGLDHDGAIIAAGDVWSIVAPFLREVTGAR